MLASQFPGCDGSGSVLSLPLYQGYLQRCRIWSFAAEKCLIGALWKVRQGLANLPVHNHIAFARGHHDDASCGGHNSVNGWHQPSREREDKHTQVTLIILMCGQNILTQVFISKVYVDCCWSELLCSSGKGDNRDLTSMPELRDSALCSYRVNEVKC